MCRLFGLHAGRVPASATFWLLDAPDSLIEQSRRNPDGVGIGVFDSAGDAHVDKQPIAAWDDIEFATAARELTGSTFVAHVRHASIGAHSVANTHPFEQDGRLFAHNGVVQGLTELDAQLAHLGASELVLGETDSERVFALITAEIADHDGDVMAGIEAAITWIGDHLPVYSLNFVITAARELWALRYPATNELWVLERPADDGAPLDVRTNRIHAQSDELAARPSVIVASERMDDDAGWRLLGSGELLHVGPDLGVSSTELFRQQPRHQLTLDAMQPAAAASQHVVP
jgi:glutamine amidotransferase